MITKKEFYFLRHGQTDGNIAEVKQDHGDISLNATGREQARALQTIIGALPIKTVCFSPLKRVVETKNIVCQQNRSLVHKEILELGECDSKIWLEMTALGKKAHESTLEPVSSFMKRVVSGINSALSYDGPVLIVSHGGIHWATCCWLVIDQHNWIIDNCILTHFSIKEDGAWRAKKLN